MNRYSLGRVISALGASDFSISSTGPEYSGGSSKWSGRSKLPPSPSQAANAKSDRAQTDRSWNFVLTRGDMSRLTAVR